MEDTNRGDSNDAVLTNKPMLSPEPQLQPSSVNMGKENSGEKSGLKERGTWGSQLDFILALIGFSVGLGNVWRFPYLCYKNGGGAFLIPYFICLVIGGIPLLILELGIGQFVSQGGISCWKLCPIFKGIGFASIIIDNYLVYYYIIILAWAVYYMILSFAPVLPWSHCKNPWNTPLCLDPQLLYSKDENLTANCGTDTPWRNSTNTESAYVDTYDVATMSGTTMSINVTEAPMLASTAAANSKTVMVCLNGTLTNVSELTPAVVEFWERKILQIHESTGLDDMGGMNWQMILCLAFAWVLVYLCIFKGVKSSGKVVYFTAPFPYVLLTILLFRAVTLENAVDGLTFYLKPNLSRLGDAQVWMDAGTQIFFSYSIGLGTMVALGSYNKYNHNFFRDGIIFACVNSGTSIYAGIVIFSVLGFMAGKQGVEVGEVAKSGPGLAFVVYPEGIAQMPIAPLWAVLFFFMVILLGIDSEFVSVEGIVTAIVDLFPNTFRKGHRREMLAAFICFESFIVGLSMVSHGGMYLFQLMDYYCASGMALLWVAFFESVAIGWVYGAERMYRDFYNMLGFRYGSWIQFCWKFFTPAFCLAVFIFSLAFHKRLSYQDTYIYPDWGYALGWLFALSSMLVIPVFFVMKILTTPGTLRQRWVLLTTPELEPDNKISNDLEANVDLKMNDVTFVPETNCEPEPNGVPPPAYTYKPVSEQATNT